MRVLLNLQNPLLQASDAEFARAVRAAAEVAIYSNRLLISECRKNGDPLPSLYDSGVVYQNEPEDGVCEDYSDECVDIPVIVERGWGDCLHLSAWLVAELREQGEVEVLLLDKSGEFRNGV